MLLKYNKMKLYVLYTTLYINKKIIIVASPNVQDNFKLQLFDERKLKNVDGIWTMKGCLGNKLIKEVYFGFLYKLVFQTKIHTINEIPNKKYIILHQYLSCYYCHIIIAILLLPYYYCHIVIAILLLPYYYHDLIYLYSLE